ncbi:hypothetical protein AAY473_020367 [Plecturocebus cupreus]
MGKGFGLGDFTILPDLYALRVLGRAEAQERSEEGEKECRKESGEGEEDLKGQRQPRCRGFSGHCKAFTWFEHGEWEAAENDKPGEVSWDQKLKTHDSHVEKFGPASGDSTEENNMIQSVLWKDSSVSCVDIRLGRRQGFTGPGWSRSPDLVIYLPRPSKVLGITVEEAFPTGGNSWMPGLALRNGHFCIKPDISSLQSALSPTENPLSEKNNDKGWGLRDKPKAVITIILLTIVTIAIIISNIITVITVIITITITIIQHILSIY